MKPISEQAADETPAAPEFVSVDQLALELGLNRKTLYNFIREEHLPGTRWLRGRIIIHRPTVVEWFRKGQGAVPRSRRNP